MFIHTTEILLNTEVITQAYQKNRQLQCKRYTALSSSLVCFSVTSLLLWNVYSQYNKTATEVDHNRRQKKTGYRHDSPPSLGKTMLNEHGPFSCLAQGQSQNLFQIAFQIDTTKSTWFTNYIKMSLRSLRWLKVLALELHKPGFKSHVCHLAVDPGQVI